MREVEAASCEHAETTTLLWLYGEGDEAHAEHVAGCAACTRVVEVHSETIARVGLARLQDHEAEEPAANRPFPWWWLAAVGAAAGLGLLVGGAWMFGFGPEEPVEKEVLVERSEPAPTPVPDPAPLVAPAPSPDRPPVLPDAPAPKVVQAPAPSRPPGPVDLPEMPQLVRANPLAVPGGADRFEADLGGMFDDLDNLEANLALL